MFPITMEKCLRTSARCAEASKNYIKVDSITFVYDRGDVHCDDLKTQRIVAETLILAHDTNFCSLPAWPPIIC